MKRSNLNVMARLVKLVRPLRGYMVLAVTMGTLGHLCATFIMIFAAFAVLHALGRPAPMSFVSLSVCMVLFAAVRAVLKYGEQGCNHYIAFRLLALIRDHVFRALRKLCPAKLEGRDKGNLISLITSDIELLEVFYAHTISPLCIAVLYTIVMVLFIGHYNLKLGLLALFSYLVLGIALPLIADARSGDTGAHVRAQAGELSTHVLDSMRGLSEIQQYGYGEQRLQEMDETTDELLDWQETEKHNAGSTMALAGLFIYLFDIMMICAGILLYWKGETSFRDVLITSVAMMSSYGPVSALAALGNTLQNTFAAGNRVLDILDEQPAVPDINGKEPIAFSGAEVQNVSFAYENEEVLRDISLEIKENRITGLIGESGSGKSTLLKLLMRFWETEKGEIRISGTDIKEINTGNLRDMEGYMTQETYLFHDTVRNNLLIAKPDATDEEIRQACRKASIDTFIESLPKGYDTEIGELGDTLSEGEKQRLGLARVFLHDAPFILLDEPTSSLDSLNEGVILKSLKEAGQGKTVLLVSHRPSTMRIADVTYSAENGRVSWSTTHPLK